MLTVRSTDGTPIAYRKSGQGAPLLLVHGASASHATTWRLVQPALERRFTVYAMDRRGRGASGDAPGYALQREAEDVAAVVAAIGAPASVLGHSFGALCALEAAAFTPRIETLILYEGVPLRGADGCTQEAIDALEALLAAGDVEGLLVRMLRDVAGLSAAEVDALRAQREAWLVRLANAPTIPRELRAEQRYVFDGGRFCTVRARTLLLVGEHSPPRELAQARAVAAALPRASVQILPGQQHIAMHTAPGEFVGVVTAFIESQAT